MTTVTVTLCSDCGCLPISRKLNQTQCVRCLRVPKDQIKMCQCSAYPCNYNGRTWYSKCEVCYLFHKAATVASVCKVCATYPRDSASSLCQNCRKILPFAQTAALKMYKGTTKTICKGHYEWLSPHAPCHINLDNQTFGSVYQYCQWRKFCGRADIQQQILQTVDPAILQQIVRANFKLINQLSDDDFAMRSALRARFLTDPHLCIRLFEETAGHLIVYEDKDLYWGNRWGLGQNVYGKMLNKLSFNLMQNLLPYMECNFIVMI